MSKSRTSILFVKDKVIQLFSFLVLKYARVYDDYPIALCIVNIDLCNFLTFARADAIDQTRSRKDRAPPKSCRKLVFGQA